MGTRAGYVAFAAPVITTMALVAGGGKVQKYAAGESCVRVPAGVAAFSEPAFSALTADRIIIEDGAALGWHFFYDENGETDFLQRWLSRRAIYLHDDKFGDLIEPDDLEGTGPSLFFMRGSEFDHQVVHWHKLRDAGYEITSTSDALKPCGLGL
jgi:hypothetical protein